MSSKLNDIINILSDTLKLEKDKSKQSPIDNIKILHDLLSDDSFILNTFKKYYTSLQNDKEFMFIYNLITNNKYIEQLILLNNHLDNPLLNIHFVLGNPYLFHKDIFNIIYDNRFELFKISRITKKAWIYIISSKSKLKKFYNNILINKWIETSQFNILHKEEVMKNKKNTEDIYEKYLELYTIFDKVNCEVKDIIYKVREIIKNNHNPGCYNLHKSYYLDFQKTYTGLTLDYPKLNIILKWADKELNKLVDKMKNILKNVHPELTNLDISDIIKKLNDDPTYKYKSEKDFINNHINIMDKMHTFFIKEKQIKEYVKPELTIIKDKNLAGAYWAFDTFYLNTTNWNEINNYEALALTLHESIPGHHTQVSYANYDKTNYYDILYRWFGGISGFNEGWALFTEELSPNYTPMERIGQLQYEILRTLRVIVDIAIHGGGIGPDEIINYMKKYLAMPHDSIESEVYRYVVLPGQALGYKIGKTLIQKIHKKYVGGNDLLSNESIELYKKILYDKEKPLDIIMQNYNISFEELFS